MLRRKREDRRSHLNDGRVVVDPRKRIVEMVQERFPPLIVKPAGGGTEARALRASRPLSRIQNR